MNQRASSDVYPVPQAFLMTTQPGRWADPAVVPFVSMDELLARILESTPVSCPAEPVPDSQYDDQIRYVNQILYAIPSATIIEGTSDDENVLDCLDPAEQSLGYVYVLNAHIDAISPASKGTSGNLPPEVLYGGDLWPRIVALIEQFDPIQVRYAGFLFRRILDIVGSGAIQTQNPFPAISLLRNAILRLDPTSSTLTSTHHFFLRVCLHGKAFQDALPILERSIYHLSSSVDRSTAERSSRYLCAANASTLSFLTPDNGLTQRLTSRHYLEYHLYGGMVYMGLKQWEKAASFLEIVLLAPSAATTSMIMVEAYKKYVLVCLLMNGKAGSPPKGMNRNAVHNVRALAIPYDCLVEGFTSGSLVRLRQAAEQGHAFWLSDCNFGLVAQVCDAFRKFSVLQLANIYAALPLTEVAQRTSPDPTDLAETASYITALIASGDVKATLTQSVDPNGPATLRFLTSSTMPLTESSLHRDIHKQRAELEEILQHLQDSDHRLEVSQEYIEKLRSLKVKKEQEVGAGGDSKGSRHLDDFDEDIMGGV